jgi:glyoxalase family protein
MTHVNGLHHVTAIAADPQENLDFYVGVLGMRLVKRSVNQDDPGTYHLFYADGTGRPGSDLTFFPWTHLRRGRQGPGLATEVQLAVPTGSLEFWGDRLTAYGTVATTETRFGERALVMEDPHGLPLALVETGDIPTFTPWNESPVDAGRQVRGLHGVRMELRDTSETVAFLQDVFAFVEVGTESGWTRYAAPLDGRVEPAGGSGRFVDLRSAPDRPRGLQGAGTVHHIAWRVADEAIMEKVRDKVAAAGRGPTPPIDRFWFRSVYFQEPGRVLFELATDGPGFTVDEAPDRLGEALILPPWLEQHREQIEQALPPLSEAGASSAG